MADNKLPFGAKSGGGNMGEKNDLVKNADGTRSKASTFDPESGTTKSGGKPPFDPMTLPAPTVDKKDLRNKDDAAEGGPLPFKGEPEPTEGNKVPFKGLSS